MVIATCSYVINDTLMKLATEGLPPYQVLMLRGCAGLLWGLPLMLALGYGRQLPLVFERRVLARNLAETAAILCYVVALANMPRRSGRSPRCWCCWGHRSCSARRSAACAWR